VGKFIGSIESLLFQLPILGLGLFNNTTRPTLTGGRRDGGKYHVFTIFGVFEVSVIAYRRYRVFTRSTKRPALARVFRIHLLEVCWTFAELCKHPISKRI